MTHNLFLSSNKTSSSCLTLPWSKLWISKWISFMIKFVSLICINKIIQAHEISHRIRFLWTTICWAGLFSFFLSFFQTSWQTSTSPTLQPSSTLSVLISHLQKTSETDYNSDAMGFPFMYMESSSASKKGMDITLSAVHEMVWYKITKKTFIRPYAATWLVLFFEIGMMNARKGWMFVES